ncbi:MAG: hypothetical protein AAFR58_00075 [Cyanobacteria bacterium J06627_28]
MVSGIKQQSIVGKDGKIEIQASELPEGAVVEVIVQQVIAPVMQSDALLASLLSKITPENTHGEIDTGASVGNEAW